MKVLLGSFSFALLLSLASVEVFLACCPENTFDFLGPNQLKNQQPVLAKLEDYDREHGRRPTVVITGSSLTEHACGFTDFALYGSPDLNKELGTYPRFRYLDKLLAQASDQNPPLECANLSNLGVMISENYLVIKEALLKKNPPQAVVLEIAPRDFIDNWMPEVGHSRLFQMLSRKQEPFSWKSNKGFNENVDVAACKLSLFYSMRGELHDLLLKTACAQTNHPASLFQAFQVAKIDPQQDKKEKAIARAVLGGNTEDCVGSRALLAFSQNEYKGRYLPVNKSRWPVELGYLKKIITLCRDHDVPLLVVNMPLTEGNLKLLPADFLQSYNQTLAAVCRRLPGDTSVTYIDLQSDKRFLTSDFRDTVHMISSGGKKLAVILAPKIVDSISGKLAGRKNLRHVAIGPN